MSTTTIRLPEDLKRRVARAAEQSGSTSHAFILQAIEDKTELVEQRIAFHAQADERTAKLATQGQVVAWEEVRQYLIERAEGKAPARPRARKS